MGGYIKDKKLGRQSVHIGMEVFQVLCKFSAVNYKYF